MNLVDLRDVILLEFHGFFGCLRDAAVNRREHFLHPATKNKAQKIPIPAQWLDILTRSEPGKTVRKKPRRSRLADRSIYPITKLFSCDC
jgi:hypothetical protein